MIISKDGLNYAIKLAGFNPSFLDLPFGRQIEYFKILKDFQKGAKRSYINAKGKATKAAVKQWLKENKPKAYYAKWRQDSSMFKDDIVDILFVL